jgi:hypothetical protein
MVGHVLDELGSLDSFLARMVLAAKEKDRGLQEERKQIGLSPDWDRLVKEMLVELRLTDSIEVARP